MAEMQNMGDVMQQLMARIQRGMTMASSSETLPDFASMTPMEREQRKAEAYNRTPGRLHEIDGYHCEKCMNRGDFHYVREGMGGIPSTYGVPCECDSARKSLARLRRSGLEDTIKECTFDAYKATEPWQMHIKEKAQQFVTDDDARWFFIGGASGGGKTHLCTAICAHYLKTQPVHYMLWEEEVKRLTAAVNDEEAFAKRMNWLKNVPVLYIDDFLKPVYRDEEMLPPTPGEMKRAYELLNHRYIEKSITIISSERYSAEIVDLDQATGGRIVQRSRGYLLNVQRDPKRNYRTRSGGLI